ncbi:MAG: hypothetical protein VST70_00880 [Nitrospirota bacterium]|nr:hypothetical protein [Nitrospirota bacterium]
MTRPPGPTGSICKRPKLEPGHAGTLIYLNAAPDVAPVLARVKANEGKGVLDDDIGYIGIFIDTEGIRAGVHARK